MYPTLISRLSKAEKKAVSEEASLLTEEYFGVSNSAVGVSNAGNGGGFGRETGGGGGLMDCQAQDTPLSWPLPSL